MLSKVQFPNSNVATKRYDKRYDNRTATCNGHNSLARAAGLGKYGYGNGFYIGNYPPIYVFNKNYNIIEHDEPGVTSQRKSYS